MSKTTVKSNTESVKRGRPALTPEAKENHMIVLAQRLAEQQLLDGTASSQTINYYLKLGSSEQRKKMEKLEEENKLLRAKTESLKSAKNSEELFEKAIRAMKRYGGHGSDDDDDNEEKELF